MMASLLTLPTLKEEAVAARRHLGRGLRMAFQVAAEQGELLLEPGPDPVGVTPMCFETARGVLAFSDPGPLFSLLGECPVTLAHADNDPHSWVWDLFLHHLSPQVRGLLGYVRLLATDRPSSFGCSLTVTLGAARAVSYLWLAPESFLALCEAGRWRPVAGSLPAVFQVAVAVALGRLQLPVTQVNRVAQGDVLMFEQSFFQAGGDGYVQAGRQRLHGRIDDESGLLRLTLTSIEDTGVDEDFAEPNYLGQNDHEPVEDVFGHEPFDELSMALHVRCGTLNLTLGELRNLAPGAVLGISGYAPGMAGLYYGDRPIGQGQLVEVYGRLGLQLTRVMFSR
ncbi:FliM/FliN family flagellar motor switch protein [Pseudomonas tolaasii]